MTNVHSTKTRIVRGGSRWGWWPPCSNPGLPAAHHTMILLQYGIINASNTWRHALQLATPKTPSQQILKPPLQTVIHELNRNCYHRFPWSNKMQNFHWHVKCSLAAWSTSTPPMAFSVTHRTENTSSHPHIKKKVRNRKMSKHYQWWIIFFLLFLFDCQSLVNNQFTMTQN